MTNQRRLALFTAGTIFRDFHHHEYSTCIKQDLNHHKTWVQASLNDKYFSSSDKRYTTAPKLILTIVSSLFKRGYSIITNKDDLTQENAKIRLVLKHNMCQESIVSKIFRRITNNHSFSQSQQQAQVTDIQARRRDQKEYKFTVHSRY